MKLMYMYICAVTELFFYRFLGHHIGMLVKVDIPIQANKANPNSGIVTLLLLGSSFQVLCDVSGSYYIGLGWLASELHNETMEF